MYKKNKRSYIREILDATDENTISFAGGLPDKEFFPLLELSKASKKVFKNANCLQYTKSQGIESLREKIAKIYTEKFDFPTTKDDILITTGSQQAFDIILKSLDCNEIIVEKPSYIGALGAFKVLDKKINGFNKIAELNDLLNKKNILYTISDYQNPSTKTYSNKKREKISKILDKKESILIEDGAYCFLNFKNKVKDPISKSYRNSFHLGSFSKIVAPGLRLGWIRASKENISSLLFAKESLDLHTSTFNQMLIDEYLNSNDLFKHINKINKEYFKKMNFMSMCFKKYISSFSFKKPKGGMFIYGSFNEDSMLLAKEALKENIAFVPGEVFYIDEKSNEARFNFTNTSCKDIEKGIKTLASIVNK
ncbi:aminotransferase-like domain-containing protein [Poseidonibacter ostreae]|jgi:2-aminoadipate transaminase|uniref:Aminotransferase class I/II-fold pyridoxal phosphate-dependent enzyme n=1 Tax=Poseidonibacter ostreae TaxID=2654171 RepID=A0A6L4WNB3_9BACT|nr:PLP-dependent aminotransferase family protein [Poseidonibacter ostreae]KAB7884866.1 aminotransferase class I/II-fold pyridoxal phosphate-dependent enzyme [Poseidonibacter ostreae]KAB7885732.1 aminotransferase class I/II-fold pyridoxal phosphate-dependent enzyme [Poseidonibacter ostreae]KAB7893039.1 aminotransferase class I/II-fold pyridoxal phosphate-dependent enzyme [Poseidonibacter ostreae]